MADNIFFNGRVISVPGSYSEVDTSGLEQVGLGASGIVAVLGTAVGGRPSQTMSKPTDFITINNPSNAANIFQSGDLLEVMSMLFAPSKDAAIPGGAQQVVAMKVNNATAATASFSNANGDAMDVVAADYGAFTSQVNVSIANGSSQGKLISITYEDQIETQDNLGGSPLFNLTYNGGYTTMVAGVESDGSIHAIGSYAHTGMIADITNPIPTPSVLTLTATASDAGKTVHIYGTVGSVATREIVTIVNGTVNTTNTFTTIYGAFISGATAGGAISIAAGATAIISFATGAQYKGVTAPAYAYVSSSTFTLKASGASTAIVFVAGKNAAGSYQWELVTLNGTTPVTTVGTYASIFALGLGAVGGGLTVTANATAARSSALIQKTIQQAHDYFNALQTVVGPTTYGFNCTLDTNAPQASVKEIDTTTADVSILNPANPGFNGDLAAIIDWINQNSQLITATKNASASGGAPSNTASPVFLAGGSEGTPVFADWQNALNLLKQARVNTIVVLTCDPAVAAALDAHCAYMCGVGRSERDGVVGLQNPGLTDVPTLTEILSQTLALNTRNLRAVAQAVTRFNTAGVSQEFQPQFTAALVAGMQAGAPVGQSLTHKYINALSFRQHTSWNPTDTAEELINAGLLFMELVSGTGTRWVRNVTTWQQDNIISNVEASVNAAVNYAVYNFRTRLEIAVGKPGFAGTINSVKGAAIGELGLLTDAGVLTTWNSLGVDLAVDVLEVSVAMAPIVPINFVKSTIHLVTNPLSGTPAAA